MKKLAGGDLGMFFKKSKQIEDDFLSGGICYPIPCTKDRSNLSKQFFKTENDNLHA